MNVEEYLKAMETENGRIETQFNALRKAYRKQETLLEENSIEMMQLKELFKKAVHRIRYAETLPGRREPFVMNFEIDIPFAVGPGSFGTSAAVIPIIGADRQPLPVTNVGTPFSAVQRVDKGGPFVATTYLSAFRLKTFSLGPLPGSPPEILPGSDPVAGTEVITPLSGRFRPISSSSDPFSGAYIGPGMGALNVSDWTATNPDGGAAMTKGFRPGSIDFLWGVEDVSSVRLRQNSPAIIPSRFLFSDSDRPLYLPVSDYFERGASIRFNAQLLHDLGYIELNWDAYTTTSVGAVAAGDQVWSEAFNVETGVALSEASLFASSPLATRARRWYGLGGTLYFSMLGYKIQQPMEPAI